MMIKNISKNYISVITALIWTLSIASYTSLESGFVSFGDCILFLLFVILIFRCDNLYSLMLSPGKKNLALSAAVSAILVLGQVIYTNHYLTPLFRRPLYYFILFVGTTHFLAVFVPYAYQKLIRMLPYSHLHIELKTKHAVVFFAVTLALDLVAFISYFPGCASYDYGPTISQATEAALFSNQQPVLYILIWKLPILVAQITGNKFAANIFYSVVQILIVDLVCLYMLVWLKRHNISSVFIVLSAIYLAFTPTFWLFSFLPTKDVFFACAVIVFATSLYDLITTENSKVTCFISCVLSCFLRNNMVYAAVALVFFALVFNLAKSRKTLLIVLPAILSYLIVPLFVYPLLNIEYTDSAELLSIPIQQISALYSYDGFFSEEDRQVIEQYLPTVADYNYRFADPVKNYMNNKLYNSDSGPFWRIYLKGLSKSPHIYLCSALDTNVPMWYPASTAYDEYSEIEYIELELYPSEDAIPYYTGGIFGRLRSWYNDIAHVKSPICSLPLVRNYLSLSFPFWILLTCLIVMIKNGKRYEAIVPIMFLLLEATYLLGPVTNYRYLYPMYLAFPLIIGLALPKELKQNQPDNQPHYSDPSY